MTRTCVGCRGPGERGELIRLVAGEAGEVAVDLAASAFGRGAWVHPRPPCIAAAGRALGRALRVPTTVSRQDLFRLVREAADRRVLALLSSARAARQVAVGSDAVHEALGRGACRLLVVATDGRGSVTSLPLHASRTSVVWGDKDALGGAMNRGKTAVVAILDDGLASAIAQAIALTSLSDPGAASSAPGPSTAHLEVR